MPAARGVVVLPLLRVLGPDLVLGRPRDEHLAQLADPLRAPAAAPDLLDLVVEVGLVEHVVAERLARLEPGQRLEHLAPRRALRPPAATSRSARSSRRRPSRRERHRLPLALSALLQHLNLRSVAGRRSIARGRPGTRTRASARTRVREVPLVERDTRRPGGDGFRAIVVRTPAPRCSSTRLLDLVGRAGTIIARVRLVGDRARSRRRRRRRRPAPGSATRRLAGGGEALGVQRRRARRGREHHHLALASARCRCRPRR